MRMTHKILIVNARGIHQARHLTLVVLQLVIIVVHRGLGVFADGTRGAVEKVAQSAHTLAAEDTENFALRGCELWRCFAAEGCQVFAKESGDAGETEVSEAATMVEEGVDALFILA